MKSTHFRIITSILLLFSFYGNLLAEVNDQVDPYADTEPMEISLEDPEYISALESVSEEDLQQEVLQRMLMFQASQCMDDEGNIPYNKTVQLDRDGSEHDETINCNDVAAIQYQIMVADQGLSERQAISCVTSGWHAEDRLEFVRALEIPVEEALACPGKDTNSLKCMGEFICGAYAGIAGMVPVAGAQIQDWMSGWARNTFDMNCSAGNTMQTLGNCLTEVVWGVIKNIVGNIEFVADGIRWIGRKLCFWCEDEHEDVSSDQQHLINSSEEIREQHTRQLSDAEEESSNAFLRFFSNIGSFLNNMILEPAGRNFGCAKWEGNRFTNTTNLGLQSVMGNDDNSQAVRCEEPMASWECASCSQRAQLVCGMVGFLGGEVITTLLTGGVINAAGKAIRVTGSAVTAIRGTKAASRVGQAATAVSRTTTRGLTSYATRGFALLNNTPLGRMAFKMGEKTVAIGADFKDSLVKGFQSLRQSKLRGRSVDELGRASANGALDGVKAIGGWVGRQGIRSKRVLFGKYSPLSPVKGYFNLLDDAFALGAGGKTGLLAARAARTESHVRNSMILARSSIPAGANLSEGLIRAQSQVDNVLGRIKSLADEAKKATPARKAQINSQIGELSREYTSATRQFEDAYKTARSQLSAQRTAAREAAQRQARELAEREAREAAQRAAQQADNTVTTTALVRTQGNPQTIVTTGTRNTPQTIPSTTRTRDIVNTVEPSVGRIDNVTSSSRTINQSLPSGWNPVTSGRNLTGSEVARVTSNLESGLETGSILRYNIRRADGTETWLFNARTNPVTGEISGNLGRTTNRNVTTFKLDDIEVLQAKADLPINGVAATVGSNSRTIPLNFRAVTDPQVASVIRRAGNATSPQAVREIETLMRGMNPDQIRQIGAEAIRNLQSGRAATPGQVAAYLKSMPGYRTLDNIPHLDDAVRAMNAGGIDEAMEIIDNAIRGNSSQTALIRESLKDAIATTMIFRTPTGAISATNLATQTFRESTVADNQVARSIGNGDVITDPARLLPPPPSTALVVRNTDDVVVPATTTVRNAASSTDDVIYVNGAGVAARSLDDIPTSVGPTTILRAQDNVASGTRVGATTGRIINPTVGGRVVAAGTVIGAVLNETSTPRDYSYNGVIELSGEVCTLQIRRGTRALSSQQISELGVNVTWKKSEDGNLTPLPRCSGMSCSLDLTSGFDNITNSFTVDGSTLIPSGSCSIINVVAPVGGVYDVTTTYSDSPPRCSAVIEHSRRGEAQAVVLTADNLEARETTLKWFKSDSEEQSEQICSGSTLDCTFPSGVTKAYLKIFDKDGNVAKTEECSASTPTPSPIDPDIDEPFNPYDTDDSDGDTGGSDLDMAGQFYEQQRSPPPSLFQAAPIPRRPTHYLHSGWY